MLIDAMIDRAHAPALTCGWCSTRSAVRAFTTGAGAAAA